jgi:hypothetical protein
MPRNPNDVRPNRPQPQPEADTPPEVEVSAFDVPEAADDVPADFGDPATAAPVYESAETAEELSGFAINTEKTDEDRSMLFPKSGDYEKRGGDPWTVREHYYEADTQPGDYSPRGRLQYTLYGPISNEDYEGTISFTLSPDHRYYKSYDTGEIDERKFDSRYKLWLQAVDYYEEVTEEKPKQVKEVINLLSRDEDLILRVYKFPSGSGSAVTGFKRARR